MTEGVESPRADLHSRKAPVASGKGVDWRGVEGIKGVTREAGEIKRLE